MNNIFETVENLKKGFVIAVKTDTVYGLICNADNKNAVNKIYDIKKREKKKPLGIFVKDKNEINKYVKSENITKKVMSIIEKWWPGALTIIFEKKDGIYDYLTNGKETIGIRIPNDDFILKILNLIDFPLAETSCNISGEIPYKNSIEIKEKLGDMIDVIIDGGEVEDNIASTVISVVGGRIDILRKGMIDIKDV